MKKLFTLIAASCLLLCLSGCALVGLSLLNAASQTETQNSVPTIDARPPAASHTPAETKPAPAPASDPEPKPEPKPEPEPEPEPQASYEITSSRALVFSTRTGAHVHVLVEITNTGSVPLYLSAGGYDLEDADGRLVDTASLVSVYPSVIAPGEKAYYRDTVSLADPPEGGLSVVMRPDVEVSRVEYVRLPVTDVELRRDQYKRLQVVGRVENTTDEEHKLTYVAAFLYDENDVCLDVFMDIVTLPPKDRAGFECSGLVVPDTVTEDAVSRIEVSAYFYQIQF